MVVCHGPGFGSVCVCVAGGGCLWNFWQLSGREQPAETRALSLVCLEQKEARSRSGPHRGFIFNHTPTTSSYPDCPHSLVAYACLGVVFLDK